MAFDVKVVPEAQEYAKYLGIKIFSADVIYQLFKEFKDHIDKLKEEAVFPCILSDFRCALQERSTHLRS